MYQIYQRGLTAAQEGRPVTMDLETRSMTIEKRKVIQNGKFEGEAMPSGFFSKNDIGCLENLYGRYLNSIPSQDDEGRNNKVYFLAKPYGELTDEDMLYGEQRKVCRFQLEFYLLACLIAERLSWADFQQENPRATWFWASRKFPSFIILKKWVEQNNNNTSTTL